MISKRYKNLFLDTLIFLVSLSAITFVVYGAYFYATAGIVNWSILLLMFFIVLTSHMVIILVARRKPETFTENRLFKFFSFTRAWSILGAGITVSFTYVIMSSILWVRILAGIVGVVIMFFGAKSWRTLVPRKKPSDCTEYKTTIRWNKLPQLSIILSILAVILATTSIATTWIIYSVGTKPQTEFQRVDVEIQRLKDRLDEEIRLKDTQKLEGIDVTWREEKLSIAQSYYYEAWNACYRHHDYPTAENLVQEAIDVLPPPSMPLQMSIWVIPICVIIMCLFIVCFFWCKRQGYIVIEEKSYE